MAPSSKAAVERWLLLATGLTALFGGLQAAVAIFARHGLTEVESIIAAHSMMLGRGEGLYWSLNEYPFTVSPYGPVLYALEAAGSHAGLTPIGVGRLVSFLAFAAVLRAVHRILMIHTGDRRCAWTGALLAGGTSNLVAWGVTGQTDMPALAFSANALERYSAWRRDKNPLLLRQCGLLIALSIFTKQSYLAAGATICFQLLLEDRRTGLRFAGTLATAGAAVALALNEASGGGYLENAVLANLNPFTWAKLGDQLSYLFHATGALLVVAAAGARGAFTREARPIYGYVAAVLVVFLLTVPKVGSDLNYQVESAFALSLCAGWSLWRTEFFDKLAAGDKGATTLLQLPLALHLVLNWAVDARQAGERFAREMQRREQFARLESRLGPTSGRVLSAETDPLLHTRGGRVEVEPLIYSLLVEGGLVDPGPVTRALANGEFSTLLLYQDVRSATQSEIDPGTPRLPKQQLEVARRNYRLLEHVPGPLGGGLYVYAPRDGTAVANGRSANQAPQVLTEVADE